MRYFIDLAYDGTNYHGWQIQPNGTTVQQVLQDALTTILRAPHSIIGAGRTDTGVNASHMVAHFDSDTPVDCANLVSRANRFLPQDIVIHRIRPVRDDAHARFSATSRTYHYYLSAVRQPFHRQHTCYFPQSLDFEAMNAACELLLRCTDFTSFSKLHTDTKTNNCHILCARWQPFVHPETTDDGTNYRFTIQADRFLRNMVRAVVGTLLEVGQHHITLSDLQRIIDQKDRCAAGQSVPGHALFLADITYPADIYLD